MKRKKILLENAEFSWVRTNAEKNSKKMKKSVDKSAAV